MLGSRALVHAHLAKLQYDVVMIAVLYQLEILHRRMRDPPSKVEAVGAQLRHINA